MIVEEYFKTPIWIESKTEWVDDLLKITDPLIKDAKESNKEKIKIKKS